MSNSYPVDEFDKRHSVHIHGDTLCIGDECDVVRDAFVEGKFPDVPLLLLPHAILSAVSHHRGLQSVFNSNIIILVFFFFLIILIHNFELQFAVHLKNFKNKISDFFKPSAYP